MKKIFATLLAIMMLIGSAACSAESVAGSTSESTESVSSVEETNAVFTYGIDSDIDDFNPMTNQMTNYISIFSFNVYEPLFHLNGDMEYTMDLATSVNQVDDVTYEFTLREGVKFHNGQDFTAQDVINTISYIIDQNNGAWRVTQYATVKDMVAEGDYKLTITLSEATPAFLDSLAYTPIFCKDDDPASLTTTANGTGAFKFVSWTPNDKIILEKYSDYWDADKIHLAKVVIKPSPDYTVAITNLQSGSLDGLNRITVENAATIEAKDGLKVIEAKSSNTMDLFEIGRHNVPAFTDTKVVQAMLLAFDADTINQAIYHGKGEVMTSCYPSGAKYHMDVLKSEYDLEKAKQLLSESSYPDGFEFDCELLKGYDAGEMAAAIWQASLAKIGIKMNLKTEEMSVWLESYLGRTYDMIWNEYGMVGSDPATFNSIILEQLYPYQLSDLTELQALIAEGKATGDDEVRKADYEKIQEIVAEYLPVYPYVAVPLACGVREAVNGLEINGMGHVFLKNVTVN